jgi:hypothetical protein
MIDKLILRNEFQKTLNECVEHGLVACGKDGKYFVTELGKKIARRPKTDEIDVFYSDDGTPEFMTCVAADGTPEIVPL